MANNKGIPAPVGVADPQVERVLWAMRDVLQSQGPDDDRIRDIARRLGNVEGGGTTGEPIRPIAPIELEATGIFGAIILEIPYLPPGAAYVEWLAADEDDLGAAKVVGTSLIPLFQHYVGDGIGRWYWVRGIGRGAAALKGPVNQTAGTYAESAQDPEYLKDVLEGELTETQLFADLASRIKLIDSAGVWSSNFDPGVDFSQWVVRDSGNTITPSQGSFRYGRQAAIITSSDASPVTPGNDTYTISAEIPEAQALSFGGRRIRVNIYARRYLANPSAEFAVSYSTSDVGNSGWQRFTPGNEIQRYTFLYDVPEADAGGTDYIGIWGDTSGNGNGVLVDRVSIDRIADENDLPELGASISQLAETVEDNDEARATQINQLSTTVSGNTATVQTFAQSINGLEAQYTVKIDNNGHVAGFGLGSEPRQDGTPRSYFIVRADRFAVVNPSSSGDGELPFIVANGNVYLDTAFIRDATITSAKIKNLAANKIVASTLSAISANLGTVSSGLFQTSAGNGARAEISSSGSYPIWVGSGSKTLNNAELALDSNGKLTVNAVNVIDTLQIDGHAVTLPFTLENDDYYDSSQILDGQHALLITMTINNPKDRDAIITIAGVWQANGDSGFDVEVKLTHQINNGSEDTIFFLNNATSNESTNKKGTYSLPVQDAIPSNANTVVYRHYIRITTYGPDQSRGHSFSAMSFAGYWR